MNPLLHNIRRLVTILTAVFVIAFLLWLFTSFSAFFAGIAFGLWLGLLSTLYTAFKVHRFTEAVAAGRRRASLGMGVRFSLAILGTLVAIRFPEYVNVIGFAIGLLLTQVFVLGDAIINGLSERKNGL